MEMQSIASGNHKIRDYVAIARVIRGITRIIRIHVTQAASYRAFDNQSQKKENRNKNILAITHV